LIPNAREREEQERSGETRGVKTSKQNDYEEERFTVNIDEGCI